MNLSTGLFRAVLAAGTLGILSSVGHLDPAPRMNDTSGSSPAPADPGLARALQGFALRTAPAEVSFETRAPAGKPATSPVPQFSPSGHYEFYFTRAVHSSRMGFRRRGSWATDWPKADQQFVIVLAETLDLLSVYPTDHPVRLDDPELRQFPFLYTLEVGGMNLSQAEAEGLRGYLLAGGFLVVDDFWGEWEWMNFESEMRRVFPEFPIVDIPLDHPIFHAFYDINQILQVPNIGNARSGRTSECGGCQPQVRGMFDDDGRLMMIINYNTDLGDAWEWSEQAAYPFQYSNFAYKMAVNFIIYAMTH